MLNDDGAGALRQTSVHLKSILQLHDLDTGPKVRFPLCDVYQNMSFPTHLAEDRAEFL